MSAVQSRKISLRTFLEAAREIQALDDRIRVVFGPKQAFFMQSLSSPESRAILEEAAEAAAGRALAVEIETDDTPSDPGQDASGGGSTRREKLLKEALDRPEVKMVMDTFGGQIVDIRDLT